MIIKIPEQTRIVRAVRILVDVVENESDGDTVTYPLADFSDFYAADFKLSTENIIKVVKERLQETPPPF